MSYTSWQPLCDTVIQKYKSLLCKCFRGRKIKNINRDSQSNWSDHNFILCSKAAIVTCELCWTVLVAGGACVALGNGRCGDLGLFGGRSSLKCPIQALNHFHLIQLEYFRIPCKITVCQWGCIILWLFIVDKGMWWTAFLLLWSRIANDSQFQHESTHQLLIANFEFLSRVYGTDIQRLFWCLKMWLLYITK